MAKERSDPQKGYVGETYVMAKLMRDFNIASVKVPQQFFSFDLITSNNKRLEVKTGLLKKSERKHTKYPNAHYYSYSWQFKRSKKQHRKGSSDFVVCMGFKKKDFSDVPQCFIIPTKELHGFSEVIKISERSKRKVPPKYWKYNNKWDSIWKENHKPQEAV